LNKKIEDRNQNRLKKLKNCPCFVTSLRGTAFVLLQVLMKTALVLLRIICIFALVLLQLDEYKSPNRLT
jgi:hypothetical protein